MQDGEQCARQQGGRCRGTEVGRCWGEGEAKGSGDTELVWRVPRQQMGTSVRGGRGAEDLSRGAAGTVNSGGSRAVLVAGASVCQAVSCPQASGT